MVPFIPPTRPETSDGESQAGNEPKDGRSSTRQRAGNHLAENARVILSVVTVTTNKRLDVHQALVLADRLEVGVASMNTLLAIVITVGLIFNSGTGFLAAAHGKPSMGAMGYAHAHPAAPQHKMHTDDTQTGNCHKHAPQSPAHGCKCCDKNAKCTHESCACLKCFSVLADVRPISHTGIALASLPGPGTLDKPPASVHQPPAPPPQS